MAREAQHRRHQAAALGLRARAVLRHDLLLLRVQQGRDARSRAIGEVHQVPREGDRAASARCSATSGAICQLHWGGGTPTFLSREETARARGCAATPSSSSQPDGECSIEVDPRQVEPGRMAFLAALGFNRVSVGVQDFDPEVQQAVHRVQSEADDAPRDRRGARERLPLGESRPHLRAAEADARQLQRHARPGARARSGPDRALQLRAPAGGVQAAAAHPRGRPAERRRRSCRS